MRRTQDRRVRIGALPPRYAFVLNPHADTKFTKCPRCETKTNLRKLSLVIHVNGFGLVLLGKTCRLCLRCETLIADKAELDKLLSTVVTVSKPEYFVLGTADGSYHPGPGRWRIVRRSEDAHGGLQSGMECGNHASRLVSAEQTGNRSAG